MQTEEVSAQVARPKRQVHPLAYLKPRGSEGGFGAPGEVLTCSDISAFFSILKTYEWLKSDYTVISTNCATII